MTSPAIDSSAARVAGSISSSKPRGQPDGAQAAKLVFAKPGDRVADGAQDVLLQVGLAADVVDQLAGERVHEHAVDREVAPGGVELGRAEDDRLGPAAVDVGAVAAEGRDLDLDTAPAAAG